MREYPFGALPHAPRASLQEGRVKQRRVLIAAFVAALIVMRAEAAAASQTHVTQFGETLWSVAGTPDPGVLPRDIPSRGTKWASGVIAAAARYVGVRYRWGGMSPAGFDCSGFIGYVLRSVNVIVPRTTYTMWVQGAPVPRDHLRVGDIVFFSTTRPGPSHAGIYIGGNQFIHASSGFGRVLVTSLDHRFYRPRYLGARRF